MPKMHPVVKQALENLPSPAEQGQLQEYKIKPANSFTRTAYAYWCRRCGQVHRFLRPKNGYKRFPCGGTMGFS